MIRLKDFKEEIILHDLCGPNLIMESKLEDDDQTNVDWAGEELLLLALKMEERGHEPSSATASGSWEQPLADSQEENGELSPTVTRNWILPATIISRKWILP